MMEPDKYVIKGAKKLFSLARTKCRLANEAKTVETRPAPLPLVKKFAGREIKTVSEASDYVQELRGQFDPSDEKWLAEAILQLMEIIEAVKYKFEPPELCVLVDEKKLKEVIEEAAKKTEPINILILDEKMRDSLNIYVGEDPPKDALHLGRVPTTLVYLVRAVLSGKKPEKLKVHLGHKTLIADAIYYAVANRKEKLGAAARKPRFSARNC